MTNHRNQLNPPSINTHRPLPFPSTTSPSTRPRTKFLFITIVMTTLLSITFLVTLVLFTSLSSATNRLHHLHRLTARNPHTASPPPPEIQQSCNATRYPSTCISHLSKTNLPQNPTPTDIIQSALTISTSNLKTAQSMVQSILSASTSNLNRTHAAHLCLDILTYSTLRTSASNSALTLGRLKDARALASAAMSYQYDCWSGLKYVNGTSLVNQTMSFIDTELLVSTSNALSMMLALDSFGNDSGSWSPPRTERDGFWPPASSGGSRRQNVGGDGFWKGLSVNVTVCSDGCDFKTVQAAVDAAPKGLPVGGSGRFVVYIKAGIYKEIVTVRFDQRNLVFLGDGMGKTVITGNLNVGIMGISTYSTATVGVLGDGFMAYGLTFENTAGPPTSQAVAFRSDSDLSYIENCEFLGNQDTLYAHSLRQLYKSCRIEGNVDFIFGNSAAVFQDCTILIRPRQLNPEKGETNAITAHGRTDPAQLTGFSYLNCSVNGTDEYIRMYRSKPGKHRNFLGRPWKEYSRTVFINCNLGEIVSPAGWLPWTGDFALKTLYYGEYNNSGPGASLDQRVPWSSQIPEVEVGVYSIDNFIQGDEFSVPTSVVDN